MADNPKNRMPWTHRLAARRAAVAALLSAAVSVRHPTWHLTLQCAIALGNGSAAVSPSFVFSEMQCSVAILLMFSSTGHWRAVGRNMCQLTFKILFSACRKLFVPTWYLLWSNIVNAGGKNQRVYVLSLCPEVHRGPEHTTDMTFWVNNFSVKVRLNGKEKKIFLFFLKALQELLKLY